MQVGYARVSKWDGRHAKNSQRGALLASGVHAGHIYEDASSGRRDNRPGLAACLKTLSEGDTLVVWRLDRLGRDLRHVVNTVHELTARGVGFRVLTGHGASIDTTTAAGRLVFGFFAVLAEYELRLAKAGMADRVAMAGQPCAEPVVARQTPCRHVGPEGTLRLGGQKPPDASGAARAATPGRGSPWTIC